MQPWRTKWIRGPVDGCITMRIPRDASATYASHPLPKVTRRSDVMPMSTEHLTSYISASGPAVRILSSCILGHHCMNPIRPQFSCALSLSDPSEQLANGWTRCIQVAVARNYIIGDKLFRDAAQAVTRRFCSVSVLASAKSFKPRGRPGQEPIRASPKSWTDRSSNLSRLKCKQRTTSAC